MKIAGTETRIWQSGGGGGGGGERSISVVTFADHLFLHLFGRSKGKQSLFSGYDNQLNTTII